ncbi:MAG TPA: PBP1A family penicillin-binding protein [Chthoniobacterales bacterium]|nr:PBP1A family penicillin-binding protein [Chthoniobacterales bacterium]
MIPTSRYEYRRPWYATPQVYIPVVLVALFVIAVAIYAVIVTAQLQARAATFDLSKLEQMESASVILDRNGKIFGQIYVENRETIPYEQLPRDLINAVVAVEDAKFYRHHGYDLFGIVRATLKNVVSGRVRQGASTITQQLARNSFALKEKTFRRKLLEIFLARRIEDQFGKQKIMELYLNRIYFGAGLYGAEAAARGYFGKHARDMSLAECATLAGLVKSPNRLSPWSDRAASRDARNYALGRMRDLGLIDNERFTRAQAEDLVIGNRQNAQGQNYAVDYIRQQVINAVGWDRAMNEGFRIRTTIDGDLQKVAEDSLRKSLEDTERHPDYHHQTYAEYAANFRKAKSSSALANQPAPEYLQGAVIGLDNETGGILVLVGGRDFEHNQYDRALQAKRPAGTAMLPFVYAAAFENGSYPGSVVDDSPLDNRAVMIGGTTGILGEWGPESADNRYEGAITARQALANSKNGATVRIGMDAGLDNVLQLCRNAGVRSALRPYPATFLGSSEITLAELALAYTIFPNGGWRPNTPHILERIEEKDGSVVWDANQERGRQNVIKPESTYEVHSCLVDALESGTGKAARTQFGLKKFPAAGKTGTAYDFTDALFAGYDSNFTCAVWAGFDKPQKIYRGAFGRELALPVWVDVMNAAAEHYPPREIKRPPTLREVEICSRSGLLATDRCYDAIKTATGDEVHRRTTYTEIASPAQIPTEPCNVHGDPNARIAREFASNESDLPRAELAVDLSNIRPIIVKGPTLLVDKDPYNSIRATTKPQPQSEEQTAEQAKIDNAPPLPHAVAVKPPKAEPVETPPKAEPVETPSVTAPIRKALPVKPEEEETPGEIRKAQPVGPLDEEQEQPLLKAETPPP